MSMYYRKTEAEAVPSFYIHPDIHKKLLQVQNRVDLKTAAAFEFNDGNASAVSCSAFFFGYFEQV